MKQAVFIIGLIFLSFTSYCQKADTLLHKLDSLSIKTDSAGGQKNNTNPRAYNESTKLTPSTYFILLTSNLKQSFTNFYKASSHDGKRLGKLRKVCSRCRSIGFCR